MTPTKLDDDQRVALLQPLFENGWSPVENRDAIIKKYQFKDFDECFKYMTKIAAKAEECNHHPEWFNVYNRLEITWSTHDCSGISALDVEMANFCDEQFK